MSDEKRCSRCGEMKPLSEFKAWYTPQGKKYRSECKQCGKPYEKKYNADYYKKVTINKRKEKRDERKECKHVAP